VPASREKSPSGIFERIRSACARVAEDARFVRVVEARLHPYARDLAIGGIPAPSLDPFFHYVGDESTTIAYFVTLDAVNFGSGYFPQLKKRPGMSGYFTVASALADRFRRQGPFDASELALVGPAACARLFGQEHAGDSIDELMQWFARAWNDLGEDLLRRFDGEFRGLVESAHGSAARLVEILSAQELFRDITAYRSFEVPLFKRAQILASDLALALHEFGLGRFDDLDRLTLFADNLVPHVLRLDGVLEYTPELLERIERGERIPAGSEEEVEIRACALHAVELLTGTLRGLGLGVTARALDNLLWARGQGARYKSVPRHRTRTVYY
jgi:hypothetical protein